MYAGWDEYTFVAGEIHQQLFSATAQREPKEILIGRAKQFASRLTKIQDFVKVSCSLYLKRSSLCPPKTLSNYLYPQPEDGKLEAMHMYAAVGLEIIMYSLQAVVYRIIPPETQDAHPLQCCNECVEASRNALSLLVQFGQMMLHDKRESWSIMFNLYIFCSICGGPFANNMAES